MSRPTVLDTSVVIKWFRQGEVLAKEALSYRSAYLEGKRRIVVPSLIAYELANVLRYKKELSKEHILAAVGMLFDLDLEWIMPSKKLMSTAVELARRYETTVYDSTFLAVAIYTNGSFITADKKLCDKLRDLTYIRYLGDTSEKA